MPCHSTLDSVHRRCSLGARTIHVRAGEWKSHRGSAPPGLSATPDPGIQGDPPCPIFSVRIPAGSSSLLRRPSRPWRRQGLSVCDPGEYGKPVSASERQSIRPFRVHIPEHDLTDLRRRIKATRWPDRETVRDQSQGVQLATMKELTHYWGTTYNWRNIEKTLNSLPMYITEIDGLDIQFIHVRSRHADALPIILTHGWPGSILEFLKVIGPLSNPTAHRPRRGRLSPRHTVDAGLWLLGTADDHRVEPRPYRARLGRADGASGIRALRFPGRGLGCCDFGQDGRTETPRAARNPRQLPGHRAAGHREEARLR